MPKYKNQQITLEQVIEIPYRENQTIKMRVRNIAFSKDHSRKLTSIQLGTCKLYLDSNLKKSIIIKKPKDFLEAIKKDSELDFQIKLDIQDSDPTVKEGSVVDTTKTYLEAIDSVLMEKKATTNYTWWINAFNELRVDYNKKEANKELKFDTYGKFVLDCHQIKTAYATPVLKDDGAKDKALVKYGTWTMTLAGHHLMPMNTFVNIRDFSDIDPDGIYQLCGLSLIDSGQLLKTVMTFRGDFTGISAGSVNQKQQTMIEEE
jgi:hypothetical protein